MVRLSLFLAAIILTSQSAHAYVAESLGFVAPAVSDDAGVVLPAVGEIVYDAGESAFKGYTQSGWTALGGSSATLVSAQVSIGTSNLAVTAGTTINFPTVNWDTHSAYSSGTYTVPVAGYYDLNCDEIAFGSSNDYLQVYKNGSYAGMCGYQNISNVAVEHGHFAGNFSQGDTITLRTQNTQNILYSAGNYRFKWTIRKQ